MAETNHRMVAGCLDAFSQLEQLALSSDESVVMLKDAFTQLAKEAANESTGLVRLTSELEQHFVL
jgi:hypothetical protein